MQLLDLPLVVRDDLERLGLDPSAPGLVIDADGNGVTLHLTHDQLTGFADRVEDVTVVDFVDTHIDCIDLGEHEAEVDAARDAGWDDALAAVRKLAAEAGAA